MSRSLATSLGLSAVALFVMLIVVDLEGFLGGIGLPREVSLLAVGAVIILAMTFINYRIVRGRPLDPSYSEEKLEAMMERAARKVVREEIEILTGRLFLERLGNGSSEPDALPHIPKPRPHLVRTNDGLS